MRYPRNNIAVIVLFIFVFAIPICFADTPDSAGITTFTGKVDSVTSGTSGVIPKITVEDNSGQVVVFMVASDAAIFGKDGNATTLNWISSDDKVRIEYITNQDGVKMAKSIKVSEDF